MKYEVYGSIHRVVKKILRRSTSTNAYRMISIASERMNENGMIKVGTGISFFNELVPAPEYINKNEVYPAENILPTGCCLNLKDSFTLNHRCTEKELGIKKKDAESAWLRFIKASEIEDGYRNAGLHYAGYILNAEEWCLPSWIWTNAALVRMYCAINDIGNARKIADELIKQQQDCGGWIVRNDYDSEGAVPVLAPNDSAYVANNACLEMYLCTKEEKYLDSAKRCADWIKATAREDGMVYVGYDTKRNHWQIKHNIVDVGFTAGLFARLYEMTNNEEYLRFLKRFTKRYIELFYIEENKGFATSLDANDRVFGGMFGRGQAWALEGMIPASRVLKDVKLNQVIINTVEMLLEKQDKSGGWAYNISRPLMGIDCKATSVIACSLMNWYQCGNKDERLKIASRKALSWCVAHTSNNGNSEGGIFSYTVEGAIVHHMYTYTAFVYGSSYAIELKKALAKEE